MERGALRRHSRRWRTVSAFVAVVVLGAACGFDDGFSATIGPPTTAAVPTTSAPDTDATADTGSAESGSVDNGSVLDQMPTTTLPDIEMGSLDDLDPAAPGDTTTTFEPPTFITDAPPDVGVWGEIVQLVEAFWGEEFEDFAGSGAYRPLDRERIIAVEDGETGLPSCGGGAIPNSTIENNALAAVCPEGQLILWDDDDLFVDLFQQYGATGPAIVIAHEFGHAIEFQAGVLNRPTVVIEQQADCLAGAFARWMSDRNLAPFDTASSLDAAVGATVSFRDQPGSSAAGENAHGSGFDRVRAFQDGFEDGVELCAQYDVAFLEPQLTQIQFTQGDFQTGGNLPFEALIDAVNPYFGSFYGSLAPIGDVTLTAEGLDQWRVLHDQIGDNATGVAMALEYGGFVQRALGLPDSGVEPFAQQVCLAGAAFRPLISFIEGVSPTDLSLSAGDMDEAVLVLSRIVEINQDVLDDGFLFDAIGELRNGFIEGPVVCGL